MLGVVAVPIADLALAFQKDSRSRASTGRIMYFPTRSASGFVLARTRLWTLKPVCRQERMRSAHSGLSSSLRTRNPRTSRAKISASRESSIRGILWKTPALSIPPSVTRKWRWGWRLKSPSWSNFKTLSPFDHGGLKR